MIDITKRLRSSLQCDAVNGNSFERSVCARQMKEASDEIDRLRAAFAELSESTRSIALHAAETIAAKDAEIARLREALTDMLSGWTYIRQTHGDLYGVGWGRVEEKTRAALAGGGA